MHLSFDDVLAKAVEIGDGWSKALVELGSGDTLWCPGTTKKVIKGRGRYEFLIHPSSVDLVKYPPGCRHMYI